MLAAGGRQSARIPRRTGLNAGSTKGFRRESAVLSLIFWAWLLAINAPARADPNALWRIVHGECVPHMEAGSGPKPCERVDLDGEVEQGVAILKDLVGVSQMLAIPTRRITGIEDPQMLAPNAPPVFAVAWATKTLVEERLHRALPREAVGLAINSKWAPSQEAVPCPCRLRGDSGREGPGEGRFCIRQPMACDDGSAPGPGLFRPPGSTRPISPTSLPSELLADGLEGARAHMGAYSLAAVGATFDGKPGFVLLADQFSLEGGGHAEDLQDHDCAIGR